MRRINHLGPHSWGEDERNWGTPPNPWQESFLHLFVRSYFGEGGFGGFRSQWDSL
jgi:hypothetical protein